MALLKLNPKTVLLSCTLFMGLCVPTDVLAFHIGIDQGYALHAGHVFMDRMMVDVKVQYLYKNSKSYEGTQIKYMAIEQLYENSISYRLFNTSFLNLFISAAYQFEIYKKRYKLSGDEQYTTDELRYKHDFSLKMQPEFLLRSYCSLFFQMDLLEYSITDKRIPSVMKLRDFSMSDLNNVLIGIKITPW